MANFTYNSPFAGFNAWANYNRPDENPMFNFSQDPYYNAQQDQQKWDLAQTGPQSEDNRSRVWRWTLDDLRARGLDPGKADQATVNQLFLSNVGRLHRDYQASGFDWNRSGFAGYDKFLAQPAVTQPGGSRGGDQRTQPGNPNSVGPGGSNNQGAGQPGSTGPATITVSGIPYTRGADGVYRNARGQTPQEAGASDQATQNVIAGGNGQNGNPGTAFGSDVLNANPDLAYQYMLRQMGWDPTIPSRFGDYLQKRFSPLLQANLAAQQVTGGGNQGATYLDNIQNAIRNFAQGAGQQGGNFFANQRDLADSVLGNQNALDYLGQISDQQQVEQYLSQLETLKYAGANPMIQQSIADTIQRGQQQYDWDAFNQVNTGQGQGDPYLTWLRNNPLYNRYLGVKF